MRNSRDSASKRNGLDNKGFSNEPWWRPISTSKSLLYEQFTLNWLFVFWYIMCTSSTRHSGISTLCKTHHRTFLGTLPKDSSRSTKIKNRLWFFWMNFCWFDLTMNIAFVKQPPSMNPNCKWSTIITLLIISSVTCSTTFKECSVGFKP